MVAAEVPRIRYTDLADKTMEMLNRMQVQSCIKCGT